MNIANRLTVSRFFLSLGFVIALSIQFPFRFTAALLLFLVAGITDYADGEIARRFHMESDFGRLMDPLVDKIMIAAAFICLVQDHTLPGWVAVVIISREFLITGLRMLAASKGVVLAAEKSGKHKTAWQMITVIFFLLLRSVEEWAGARTEAWWHDVTRFGGPTLIALALALTLYSGLGYLWKNRALIDGV